MRPAGSGSRKDRAKHRPEDPDGEFPTAASTAGRRSGTKTARNNHRIRPSDKHLDRVRARVRSPRHESVANPARPAREFQRPALVGSSWRYNLRSFSLRGFGLLIPFSSFLGSTFQKDLRFPSRAPGRAGTLKQGPEHPQASYED